MKRVYFTGKYSKLFIDLTVKEYERLKDLNLRLNPKGYVVATINGKTTQIKDLNGKNYRIKIPKDYNITNSGGNLKPLDAIQKVPGIDGVYKIFDHYQAWITLYYGMEFIGNFKTLDQAKNAYRKKCKELFGKDILSVFD